MLVRVDYEITHIAKVFLPGRRSCWDDVRGSTGIAKRAVTLPPPLILVRKRIYVCVTLTSET